MSLAKLREKISIEEYLEGEKVSQTKHEYVCGAVYAMAGASRNHNRIIINLSSRLHERLIDSGCEVFSSDMKVRVDAETFYYPDVVVSCDSDNNDRYVIEEPRLVIEVLSHSTERTDRGEKLFTYRRVPSLQEYVIVAQDRVYTEIYTRLNNEDWATEVFTEIDETVNLTSVEFDLNVNDIYRNVRFEETESE